MSQTCDEYSATRKGVCGRPLDERGQCDRAGDHGDHLSDNEPIIPGPATPLERGAGAMETTPDQWLADVTSLVPAHMRDDGSGFCAGGEKVQIGGRCQYGCDHAEHYSNDGHPECEDIPIIPTTKEKTP